ncbi:MAG: hypothetical protein HKK66_03350 [Chlorobiaceae bacterium]|nr:hypothetical protein [Chlorobiaceae bacterium]
MTRTKRANIRATTMIAQLMPSAAACVEIELTDKQNVTGVSYSPKKRKWRAYLHIGKKQVYHQLFDEKADAITGRLAAEEKYIGDGGLRLGGYPPFERKIKPPKYRDLTRTLEHLAANASAVLSIKSRMVISDGGSKRTKESGVNRKNLGHEIGRMIAVVDLLVMSGDVDGGDIEEGMKSKVASLKEGY